MCNGTSGKRIIIPCILKLSAMIIKGILTEVSSIISSFDINISYAQIETDRSGCYLQFCNRHK